MAGAVTSFCFQEEFLRLLNARRDSRPSLIAELMDDPRLHFAVGLHPKTVADLTTGRLEEFIGEMRALAGIFQRRFVGIGEVGLDYTTRRSTWRWQRVALKKILVALRDLLHDKVIVLHLRSSLQSDAGAAHDDALEMLRDLVNDGILSSTQALQLHYFSGGAALVRRWRQVSENTYFSVPGTVEGASEEQVGGLREIHLDRLLLETDAGAARPLQSVRRRRSYAAPFDVHRVAQVVGPHLSLSSEEVLRITTENARRLFGDGRS